MPCSERQCSAANTALAAAAAGVDVDQAARGLDHIVKSRSPTVRAVRSIAGNRAVDDARIDLNDSGVRETQALDGCHAHVVDEDVGILQQKLELAFAFFLFQVKLN